jgi:acyl-CoA thioesterase II
MEHGAPFVDRFIDRVTLERIDRDIFQGQCHSGAPLKAFGGQIAAQALRAAGATVEEADRFVHSLHGYFLRPGRTIDPITYLVDRPRDGRSFSTRFVRAVQGGETIFMMTASFATVDPGPEHQFDAPKAPDPEDLDPSAVLRLLPNDPSQWKTLDYPLESHLQLRMVGGLHVIDKEQGRFERMCWVRVTEPLPDDELLRRCALTYISDLTMVSTAISPHGEVDHLQLASIDHAVWFHAPVNPNDWLLFSQDTPRSGRGHGLARGLFYDRAGVLVASVVQESLMRERRK